MVALCDVDFGYVDRQVADLTRQRGPGGGGGRGGGGNAPQMTEAQMAAMQKAQDERRAQAVKLQEAYKNAKRHTDFRKMLESQKDIDAIVVATPDHLHATIAKTANRSVVGMTERESAPLLKFLFEHSVDPLYTYRHKWEKNDIIMWDNRSTMHLALADFDPGAHRYCMRTTILGTPSGHLFQG